MYWFVFFFVLKCWSIWSRSIYWRDTNETNGFVSWMETWKALRVYSCIFSCVSWRTLVLLCYTRGNCSTLTFLPFDLILLLWYLWADATYLFYCPYCVKHRVLIFIKGLLKKKEKKYFVHNVKPESVYFGKNVVSEIIASSKQKQLLKTFTINNMKCSAVRKDFWCLTNKVNQMEDFPDWLLVFVKLYFMLQD